MIALLNLFSVKSGRLAKWPRQQILAATGLNAYSCS
jgi:hypothetical protein